VATILILSTTTPEGPSEVLGSDAFASASEGCDSVFPVSRFGDLDPITAVA
jgi:hypothetical protein